MSMLLIIFLCLFTAPVSAVQIDSATAEQILSNELLERERQLAIKLAKERMSGRVLQVTRLELQYDIKIIDDSGRVSTVIIKRDTVKKQLNADS